MQEKIIAATLKVNTGTSAQDIGAVNKSLDQTSKELGGVNEDAKTTKGSFDTLKDGLGKLPGPLGAVKGGVESVNTSLKALAANPIVLVVTLLVAAMVALYKAFASTESGAEKIEQIFSGLGAIVTVIRDRILALAGAVVDFFKGNFSKAIEETKQAVTGVGDAMVTAYGKAANATRELQEAQDDLNRVINVNRAKLERDLAATKELITDETASYRDRKKAIDEVREAEQKQTQSELDNANKTLKALQDKLDLDKEDTDTRDAVAAQQAKIFNIQQQQSQTIRQLNKADHNLDQQERAEADAANKTRHDNEMQRLAEEKKAWEAGFNSRLNAQKINQQFIDNGIAERKKQAEEQRKQEADEQKKIDDEFQAQNDKEINALHVKIAAENKANKDQADFEKKLEQQKITTKEAALATTSSLFAAAANLAGRSSALGKAFAVAGTTIDTYRSAIAAFKGMVEVVPGPVGIGLGIAAAAAAVANGLAAVKNIVAVKVPGGYDTGIGGAPSGLNLAAPSAPVAPTQQGTSIDQDSINGIGSAVSGRSYVLSQDVTHDQDTNERLNRAARLGG